MEGQEVTYPSAQGYTVCTDKQGVDIAISTDIDAKFCAYLSICPDDKDQTDANNFELYALPAVIGSSENGELALSIGARKFRHYAKVFVSCDNPAAAFTATLTKNMGV